MSEKKENPCPPIGKDQEFFTPNNKRSFPKSKDSKKADK